MGQSKGPIMVRVIRRMSLLVVVLAARTLMGCDRTGEASKQRSGPGEVRLGYFANVTHAQAVLGVASGDFAGAVAPAKFSTKTFNAGPSLVEALFAGEIDLGYIG